MALALRKYLNDVMTIETLPSLVQSPFSWEVDTTRRSSQRETS